MKALVIAALLSGALVTAQTPNDQNRTRTRPDIGTNVQDPDIDFYDSISDYFRQSSRAVEAIAQKGIPAQDIPAVLTIARKSSMSPNQVIDARKQGKTFEQIAEQAHVTLPGTGDFVTKANIRFLSEYHGRSDSEVRAMHDKGANFIAINQQYRRVGVKPRTEKAAGTSPGR